MDKSLIHKSAISANRNNASLFADPTVVFHASAIHKHLFLPEQQQTLAAGKMVQLRHDPVESEGTHDDRLFRYLRLTLFRYFIQYPASDNRMSDLCQIFHNITAYLCQTRPYADHMSRGNFALIVVDFQRLVFICL